jgi:hypothetical protein
VNLQHEPATFGRFAVCRLSANSARSRSAWTRALKIDGRGCAPTLFPPPVVLANLDRYPCAASH